MKKVSTLQNGMVVIVAPQCECTFMLTNCTLKMEAYLLLNEKLKNITTFNCLLSIFTGMFTSLHSTYPNMALSSSNSDPKPTSFRSSPSQLMVTSSRLRATRLGEPSSPLSLFLSHSTSFHQVILLTLQSTSTTSTATLLA